MTRFLLLLVAIGGWLASPPASIAQPSGTPVVGFLNSASAEGYSAMAEAFRRGLAEAGFRDGQNVVVEHRWADNRYDRLPALAADLARRGVAVIFANAPSIEAARAAAAGAIPIVFASGDPVAAGFVASLNRPGGTMTGVSMLAGELGGKRLAVLHEIVPAAKTIAVLINADFGPSDRFGADVAAVASARGLALNLLRASSETEIRAAFATLAGSRPDALLVGPGPFLDGHRNLLVELAAKAAIPAAYETRSAAEAGGLASYGASVADGYRQAGAYVGRILKGEKPADLPVVLATKVEFVLNLRTAKTLDLAISPALLAQADEVIE